MKKHLLVLVLGLLCLSPLRAQFSFQNNYGIGTGMAMQKTADHGFIMAGYAEGSTDIMAIIKTDSMGVSQWVRSCFMGSDALRGYSVLQTSDGGYIVSGAVIYPSLPNKILLLKVSPAGVLQWKKYFLFSSIDYGFSVQETSDGGFILTGRTYNSVFLVKTTSDGTLSWSNTYGNGVFGHVGKCVRQTFDHGYIVTGYAQASGVGNDVYLLKTDSTGTVEWSKTYGGNNDDFGTAVEQTADSGYAVVGHTFSYSSGINDMYLLKTNSGGDLEWTKTYGDAGTEEANALQITSDGGFILAGNTNSYGMGDQDFYLVKTTSDGSLQWAKTFGGLYTEIAYAVAERHNGGYAVLGFTITNFPLNDPKIYLVTTNSAGSSSCNETTQSPHVGTGGTANAGSGALGGSATTGTLSFTGDSFGVVNSICSGMGVNTTPDKDALSIFPNPFSSTTTLYSESALKNATLRIFDLYGRQVMCINQFSGNNIPLHRNGLPDGLYVVQLSEGNQIISTQRVIISAE